MLKVLSSILSLKLKSSYCQLLTAALLSSGMLASANAQVSEEPHGSTEVTNPSAGGFLYRVPLQVSSKPVASVIEVAPSALSFADLPVGSLSSAAIVLSNPGATSVSLSDVTLSGSQAYALDASLCLGSLGAGQNCAIGVSFTPNTRGPHAGSISVVSSSGLASISLTGRGLQGELQANASEVSFDPVVVGDASSRSLQIENTGDALVESIEYATGAPFSITEGCSALAPGSTCDVLLQIKPSVPGSASGELLLTSSVGSLSVSLSGSAIAAQSVPVLTSSASVSFGSVTQGATPADRSVSFRNDGNVPLTLSGLTGLPSAVSIHSNNCSSVAPAATCSIVLRLNTSGISSFTGVTIKTLGGSSNATLSLTGEVKPAGLTAAQFSALYSYFADGEGDSGVWLELTNKSGELLTVTNLSWERSGAGVSYGWIQNMPGPSFLSVTSPWAYLRNWAIGATASGYVPTGFASTGNISAQWAPNSIFGAADSDGAARQVVITLSNGQRLTATPATGGFVREGCCTYKKGVTLTIQ